MPNRSFEIAIRYLYTVFSPVGSIIFKRPGYFLRVDGRRRRRAARAAAERARHRFGPESGVVGARVRHQIPEDAQVVRGLGGRVPVRVDGAHAQVVDEGRAVAFVVEQRRVGGVALNDLRVEPLQTFAVRERALDDAQRPSDDGTLGGERAQLEPGPVAVDDLERAV